MNHQPRSPDRLIEHSLERGCELYAHRILSKRGGDLEAFGDDLHEMLERAICRTMTRMEHKMKIAESLNNPKISK